MAMAVHHSIQHLSEQKPRLLLTQTLPVAHVCVHVAMVIGQKDIHTVLANHHVLQATDVVVVTNPGIGSQVLLVATQREHL